MLTNDGALHAREIRGIVDDLNDALRRAKENGVLAFVQVTDFDSDPAPTEEVQVELVKVL